MLVTPNQVFPIAFSLGFVAMPVCDHEKYAIFNMSYFATLTRLASLLKSCAHYMPVASTIFS
jgi:hypothetical protein